MNKRWRISFVILVMLAVGYYVFKPTYEIRLFKLTNDSNVYLTQMIYWSWFDRQLIYIYGKHTEESYPERDYVTQHKFGGIDAVSHVVASAKNQIVTINYSSETFEAPILSDKIKLYEVESYEEMEVIRSSHNNLFIVAE